MKNKKSRLGNQKFAFAQRAAMENDDIRAGIEAETPSPSEINTNQSIIPQVAPIIDSSSKSNSFTRLTVQVDSQVDRKIEFARVILQKKKQDLINELLTDALARLNVQFPSQL